MKDRFVVGHGGNACISTDPPSFYVASIRVMASMGLLAHVCVIVRGCVGVWLFIVACSCWLGGGNDRYRDVQFASVTAAMRLSLIHI